MAASQTSTETAAPLVSLSFPVGTTHEQVAAVVAVVLAASGSGGAGDGATSDRVGGWAAHDRAMRQSISHGRGAWRAAVR